MDALFNSLARNAGSRAIGIVPSGMLKDDTLGLKGIKEARGRAFVQSRQSPLSPKRPDMHPSTMARSL